VIISNGQLTTTVVPNAIDPSNTAVVGSPPDTVVAGGVYEVTIRLLDQYSNVIGAGQSSVIDASIAPIYAQNGPVSVDDNGDGTYSISSNIKTVPPTGAFALTIDVDDDEIPSSPFSVTALAAAPK